MIHSTTPRALVALGVVATLLVVAVPTAAESRFDARAVGAFLVDAQGRASGLNLAATISEADGVVSSVSSLSLEQAVFDSVAIEGFSPRAKLEGVGSASLLLKGTNAVLSLHDNANGVLAIASTGATSIKYDLAPGILAVQHDGNAAIVDLVTRDDDEWLGSLVAVGARASGAPAAALAPARGEVIAVVEEGALVAFVGRPAHLASDAFQEALLEALADGTLAASYITELDAGAVSASHVSWSSASAVRTIADGRGLIESTIRSAEDAPVLLAYDLGYETLPVRSASDVAVFADGHLLARAESAAEVRALASQDIASYFAVVEKGRAQVLAATPSFEDVLSHKLSLAAGASSPTESQMRAEGRAEQLSRVSGLLDYEVNGKLLGSFLTGVFQPGRADIHHYTSLASGAEVFRLVSVDGNRAALMRSIDESRFLVEGSKADLTLVDDAYSTLLVEAKSRSDASFALAPGIKAVSESPNVVRLVGAKGDVGWLVAVAADGAAPAQLDATSDSKVLAALDKGARVIFRGATGAFPSEGDVARAIADGAVGAQLLAGVQGADVATSVAPHYEGVSAKVLSSTRGALEIDYYSLYDSANAIVLDARGAALPAKAASDIRVLVDDQPAVAVATAEAALSSSPVPKYFAETSADGGLRVIVNAATGAGESARILIESNLDKAARQAADTDAFGRFKLFQDGTAVGDFVTLRADAAAGAISDFTMVPQGQVVLSSVVAGASPFASNGADGAATLLLENAESRIEIADTTAAFLRVVAKQDTAAAFRVAPGLLAAQRAPGVIELVDEAGAHVGSLILVGGSAGSDLHALDGGQIVARLERGAQVVYKAHVGIESELSSAQRSMMSQAIAAGRVAGQVLVQTQGAGSLLETHAIPAADIGGGIDVAATQLAGSLTAAVTTSYLGDIEMATAATKDRVDVTISSAIDIGRTILISLDPSTVPGLAKGDAEILFDGVPAKAASSYADVLDATDDKDVAEYFVLAGDAGSQVLVSIPHFSVHTVTLKSASPPGGALYPYATIVLGVLVAAQGVMLIRRRKA